MAADYPTQRPTPPMILTAHAPTAHADWSHLVRRGAWLVVTLFCATFAGLEVANHGPWMIAAALLALITPDLTMLIGASQASSLPPGHLAPRAVPFYNAVHRAWVPLGVLTVYAVAPWHIPAIFTAVLGWLTHIALDRTAGYGLRAADGSHRG